MKQGKEGFIFGVKEGTFRTVRELTESELKNVLTVKVEYARCNLRVIIGHAPQGNEKVETRAEFFEEMCVQIERAVSSGDEILLLGDFNARVSYDGKGVVAEHESPNGKKMVELLEKYSLKIGNFHPNTSGKWTRIQSDKTGCVHKSAIDYVIVGDKLFDSIRSVLIDEDKIYCPYREKTVKGLKKVIFSDHCSLIVDMSLEIGQVRRNNGKKKVWNFRKEGYEKYLEVSKADIVLNTNDAVTSTDMYCQWEK